MRSIPFLAILCLSVGLFWVGQGPAAIAAPPKTAAPLAANEVAAKAPPNYLALSRLHFAVVVDANREFRELELEVWLLPKGEDNLALVRSAKKQIMAALQEDFSAYNWEAFKDADAGPQIAKKIVTLAVERVSGGKLDDVLIRSLVLH